MDNTIWVNMYCSSQIPHRCDLKYVAFSPVLEWLRIHHRVGSGATFGPEQQWKASYLSWTRWVSTTTWWLKDLQMWHFHNEFKGNHCQNQTHVLVQASGRYSNNITITQHWKNCLSSISFWVEQAWWLGNNQWEEWWGNARLKWTDTIVCIWLIAGMRTQGVLQGVGQDVRGNANIFPRFCLLWDNWVNLRSVTAKKLSKWIVSYCQIRVLLLI